MAKRQSHWPALRNKQVRFRPYIRAGRQTKIRFTYCVAKHPVKMPCTQLSRVSRSFLVVTLALLFNALSAQAQTVDEDAAVALAKKGNCFKCHAVEKRKKAPSYREVAKKYAGKPNSEQTLFLHITGKPILKLEEGDEPHAGPPSDDPSQLTNLIKWILSRNTAT